MQPQVVVGIGASAGGIESLRELVSQLPATLDAALLVVLHVSPTSPSVLPEILARAGKLPVHHAIDGEALARGTVLVAPPDYHLLCDDAVVRLDRGPRENGHRPAVDRLFRTMAAAHGERSVAVVLSGTLDDGTAGVTSVLAAGGRAVAQDPAEALYPDMPRNAARFGLGCEVLPVREIAERIVALASAQEPPDEPPGRSEPVMDEQAPRPDSQTAAQPGEPSGLVCPECGGGLWETESSGVIRLRCRVGHAYTVDGYLAEQARSLEGALWTAVRALDERAAVSRRLATRFGGGGHQATAARYQRLAEEYLAQGEVIRGLLSSLETGEIAVEG
jgi:two-component system chemotaxis response regulator CheB